MLNIKNLIYKIKHKITQKSIDLKNIKNIKKYLFFITLLFLTIFTLITISKIDIKVNFKLDNLENINKFTNYYNLEYEEDDEKEFINPSYEQFYKKNLAHSFYKKLLVKFNIKKTPIFDIKNFISTLDIAIKENKNNNIINASIEKYGEIPSYKSSEISSEKSGKISSEIPSEISSKKNHVNIKLSQGARCIIFGDLNGALNSFSRDLTELYNQKIIDKNLKIIPQNTYIIFLGNIIGKAPFCLALLESVMNIMIKNPNKVFYLASFLEKNGEWKNYSMRQAIKILFQKYISFLPEKIDEFLQTLPQTLTITLDNPEKEKIVFLEQEESKSFQEKEVKIAFVGEKKLDIIKEQTGLRFFDYEYGTAVWSIISCPTMIYKKFASFYYDSFVELKIGKTASSSTIILNNRDTRKPGLTFKKTMFDPIFGKEINKDSDIYKKNTFDIGSTMSFSGITASIVKELKNGLETAIFFSNKTNNFLIRPIILDDEYSPRLAKMNIEKLFKEHSIKSIISPNGTATTAFYLDMVKNGQIFVFFPQTGAQIFRKKELKNMIHFRASYEDEAKTTINYLVKETGAKNIAFFYQDDAFGKPIFEAACQELKKLGVKNWLAIAHKSTQTNFKDQIKKLREIGPDTIALFSTSYATQEFIEQVGPEFFSEKIVFGTSILLSKSFKDFLKIRGIEFLDSSIVPDPISSNIEITKEFRKNILERGINISSNCLEGYINGSLIIDAINKITPPITGEKIIQHFENMKNYNYKGLKLTFNPENRSLSQPVWLKNEDNVWINCKY